MTEEEILQIGRMAVPAGDLDRVDRSLSVWHRHLHRIATLYARGKLGLNEDFSHEGILETMFTGRLIGKMQVG